MNPKCTLAASLLVVLFAVTAWAELKVGDDVPAVKMRGSDGKDYNLADFKGKQAVLIAWFPRAFTRGCTAECNSLRSNQIDTALTIKSPDGSQTQTANPTKGSGLKEYDIAVFAASCDTPELNKQFADALKLDYPILSDPDKKVAAAFGVLNADRGISNRWTFYIGKDGKVLHIDKEVKTDQHGTNVAAKLDELGIAKK